MDAHAWRSLELDEMTFKRLLKLGLTVEDLQVWRQDNPNLAWHEYSPRGYRTRFKAGHEYGFQQGQTGAQHPATLDGRSHHYLYYTWRGMLGRCYSSNHASYKYYGARGIKVCERWHDPLKFYEDIERLLGPRPLGHTLDRKDNNGDYDPDNVRWATSVEQRLNDRRAG